MDERIRLTEGFLDDLLSRDVAAARDRLHPRVRLRALQSGTTVGHTGAAAVAGDRVRQLACWDDVHVLYRRVWHVAGRVGLDLRLHLFDGSERWEYEQRLYLDVDDGLIRGIDLLASGCRRPAASADPTSPAQGDRP